MSITGRSIREAMSFNGNGKVQIKARRRNDNR